MDQYTLKNANIETNVLALVRPRSRNLSFPTRTSAAVAIPAPPRHHHGRSSAVADAGRFPAAASARCVSAASRSRIAACCCDADGNKPSAVVQRSRAVARSPSRVAAAASAASRFNLSACVNDPQAGQARASGGSSVPQCGQSIGVKPLQMPARCPRCRDRESAARARRSFSRPAAFR